MNKIIALLLCIVFALAGCQSNIEDNTIEKEGVYYRKISDREVSYKDEGGLYECTTLYYDEHIYNSIESYVDKNKSELKLDEILGEEIGVIYGNHKIYWSVDKDKLYEVTDEGKLYKVKGYDDQFRVCVYYENIIGEDHFYHLDIYECLNDMTLDKGSELFKELFRLDNAMLLYVANLKSAEEAGASQQLCKLSVEDSTVGAFLEAINNGKFIAPEDEEYPSFDGVKGYSLIFTDNLGLEKRIGVFANGYVTTLSQEKYIMVVRVDKDVCSDMISMIDKLFDVVK